jgi:enoyl-CoA hydratase/carnithine racemase
MAASDRVTITVEDTIAWVTLDRPEAHNGMDFDMLDAVIGAQREVRRHRDVRAVVIRGAGKSFCAGLDFRKVTKEPWKAALRYPQVLLPWRNQFQKWSLGWRDLGLPVIAAVHGNCFGAGLQLALGADIRICTPDARLSIMEAKWGLVPDMGGAALLRELVPVDVAKELTMTGRVLSGADAKSLGLVTHVDEDPVAAARTLAAEIATRSPDSVAAGKFLMQEAYGRDEAAVTGAERRWQRRLLGFANFRVALKRNASKSELPYARRRIG